MTTKIIELNPVYSRITDQSSKASKILSIHKEYWTPRMGGYGKEKQTYLKSLVEGGRFLTGFAPRLSKEMDIDIDYLTYDVTPTQDPYLDGVTFRDDQLRQLKKALDSKRGVLLAPTGCISGETIIHFNRAKKGYTQTIKKAFEQQTDKRRKKQYPTKVRSYDQNKEKIHLHDIIDIVYSGEKFCLKLLLSSGKFLTATPDHKIMTNKGWVELQNLDKDFHLVMTDTPHAQSQSKKKKSITDNCCVNLWYHPYASILNDKGHNCRKKGYSKRAEKHRCIYEAHLNKMTLDDFLFIVRNDPIKSSKLKFVNPKKFHIHHKDENHKNNVISNLECIPCKKHLQFHAKKCQYNFHQGIPVFEKIISVVPMGIQHTYDIRCKEPYHNFVANDIVVHNSGKTILICGLISAFPKARILFLVHTIDLVNQALKEFERFGFSTLSRIGNGEWDMSGRIVVSSIQSFAKLNAMDYCDQFDVVFVDEGHHVTGFPEKKKPEGGVYYRVLSHLYAPYRYAVTATLSANEENKLCLEGLIGEVIDELSFQEANDLEILAVPKVRLVKVNPFQQYDVYKYPDVYDHAIVHNLSRNKRIIMEIIKLNEEGLSTVTYVQRKDHIKNLMDLAEEQGVELIAVQGSTKGNDRLEIKNYLHEKVIMNVVATVVWREGVNIKSLNAIIIAGGGKDEKDLIQACGRGARKDDGKDEFVIVDFIDSAKFLSQHFCERLGVYVAKGWL